MRASRIIAQRQRRRFRQQRQVGSKTGLNLGTLVSLLAVVIVFGLTYAYVNLTANLPSIERLPAALEPPDGLLLQPTRIYDRTGEHLLAELAPANTTREYLTLDQFSPSLINATLAAYDPGFWESPGYSLNGLTEGTQETLAQRLASALLLENEELGLRRNIRERILAAQITHRFGREQVLEWYLNTIAYGPLVYGSSSAAKVYFDKDAAHLTLAESTALVAASQTPDITPSAAPESLSTRQQEILGKMMAAGYITVEEILDASAETVSFQAPNESFINTDTSFIDLVKASLFDRFGRARVERGGLIVTTSLDFDLQQQATCAAAEQLRRLNGVLPGTLPIVEECQAAALLPSLVADNEKADFVYHANLVILEPDSGQILALVADRPEIPGLSPVSVRSTGTIITPFVYLASFTRGFGPASLLWDVPASLLAGDTSITPEIAKLYHGPVRLRTAFSNDYTSPASQVLAQISPELVARTADQLGLHNLSASNLEDPGEGQTVFPGEASTIELAQAYGVIATGGYLTGGISKSPESVSPIEPIVILNVKDTQGAILQDCTSNLNCSIETRSVVSTELAYLIHHMLSDNFSRWSSLGHPNLLEFGQPSAAKIGRVDDVSGWTAGYIRNRIVVSWVGTGPEAPQDSSALDPVYGSVGVRASAALWRATIQYAGQHIDTEQNSGWTQPPGISQIIVCDPSGLLPSDICPTTVSELFLTSNKPQQADTLFRAYQVNRETGRLATIFTPPALVDEQVFMVVPAFASAWADAAGILSVPRNYDVITAPPESSPYAVIRTPELFGYTSGKIQIKGTASGQGFVYYRLQAGAGLNPSEWIQIGEDIHTPVSNGVLAEWDTSELNGLFALQLLVVRDNQSVDSSIIQVTIDNEAPLAEILSPGENQTLGNRETEAVILICSASDETALERVEFSIDNEMIASLTQEPFILAWQAESGTHTFRIRAYDMAGNWTEETVQFTVE